MSAGKPKTGGRRELTEAQRARILEMHGNRMSRNAIWRELKGGRYACSQASISKVVAEAGESFERAPEVRAATIAKAEDAAAIRARMELKFAILSEHLANRAVKEMEYIDHGGQEYQEVRWTLEEPTPADQSKLIAAAAKAWESSQKQADVTARSSTGGNGRSLIATIRDAFIAAGDIDDPDDTEL